MRGVYDACAAGGGGACGSSPHARGLQGHTVTRPRPVRIIPACAGFTSAHAHGEICGGDHPRMRGVYYHEIAHEIADQGSSPHARGLPQFPRAGSAHTRIIPACAGFTTSNPGTGWSRGDHPRMRGVYLHLGVLDLVACGSSPHARGLLAPGTTQITVQRIIPACAGFTLTVTASLSYRPDHPRMRGVYVPVPHRR